LLRSKTAGFDMHLVKPIDLDQLARSVAGEAPLVCVRSALRR
jgi:hypothetical protein